jgi:hypothetical protein
MTEDELVELDAFQKWWKASGNVDGYSIAREAWHAARMVERERCANIVENFDYGYDETMNELPAIAEALRKAML